MTWQKKPSTGTVYQEFPIMQFAGLNNRDASIHIDDKQASDLLNVHFDNRGAITKRNGYTALNATAIDTNPIKSLFPFYKSDGTKKLLATSGTSIYDVTSGTPATVKSVLSGSGQRFTSAIYLDKIYLLNGNTTDGLMKWDGTTFATVTGAPNGKYLVVHKNRLYIAGDPSNPSRLYMSDIGNPESFPSLNFIDIDTNDGDVITGIAEHLDSLVIFKERGIQVLRGTGPQNYTLVDSHQSHGTVSHWSIAQVMNQLFYLSRDGVYAFDGKSIHLMSDDIRGSVLGLNNNAAWNQQFLVNACGSEYKNKYWLSVTEGNGQTTNNRTYVYDITHKAWTRYDLSISCFSLFQSATSATYDLYSGDVTQGFVYHQDTGTSDNGANINAYFKTKDFDFGVTSHFKSYKGLFFAAQQQNQSYAINIQYIQDLGKQSKIIPLNLGGSNASKWGTFVWGVDPWGAVPNVAKGTTAVSGASRFLSFKVFDNSTNPFCFFGWVIRYQVKRRLA